jgi:hypothetical protein
MDKLAPADPKLARNGPIMLGGLRSATLEAVEAITYRVTFRRNRLPAGGRHTIPAGYS